MRVGVALSGLTLAPGTGAARVWSELRPRLRARVQLFERGLMLRRPDVWLMPAEGRLPRGREPLVAVLHGAPWTTEPGFADHVPHAYAEPMIAMAEAMIERAGALVVPSEYTRAGLAARYGVEAVVVSHGVDAELFRPRAGDAPRGRYVLFPGDPAVGHKNVAALREAMGAFPDHELVVAGGGSRVGDRELADLMGRAAAVCVPSLFEAFGLPALEAMACGTPVVASNRGALPEVVGDAAVTCEPTPDGLREALALVLGDGELAERLGRAGRARAETMTWERTADGWLDALSAAARAN